MNDRVLLPKIGQKGSLAPPEGDVYNSITVTQRGRRIEADLRVFILLAFIKWAIM